MSKFLCLNESPKFIYYLTVKKNRSCCSWKFLTPSPYLTPLFGLVQMVCVAILTRLANYAADENAS